MTCIAAIKTEDRIYLGSDKQSTLWGMPSNLAGAKIFEKGGFLFGITGTVRFLDLLQHSLTIPKHDPDIDIHVYMVTTFANAIRGCLRDAGALTKKDEVETTPGYAIIVYQGRLFTLYADCAVSEYDRPYAAIGSGGEIAFGSLCTTEDYDIPQKERLQLALESAVRHNIYCCAPFDFLEQSIPEEKS